MFYVKSITKYCRIIKKLLKKTIDISDFIMYNHCRIIKKTLQKGKNNAKYIHNRRNTGFIGQSIY